MNLHTNANVRARIARLRGQIHGLAAMIDGERDTMEILTLISAIRAALSGLGGVILVEQIEQAILETPQGEKLAHEDVSKLRQMLREAIPRVTK